MAVFAGRPLPPLTLVVINFSKNCGFSIFSQFCKNCSFFVGHPSTPVPLDLINFSKNCDFSNFSRFLEESQKLQKSQFLLLTLLPSVTLDLIDFIKNCDFSNFPQFLEKWRKCRNAVFVGHPCIFFYHLNLVILAKTAISPIFAIFATACKLGHTSLPDVGLVQGSNILIL